MAEVVLRNLVKRFGDFVAVKNLDLTIRDREFLVLLGPSGCGKTTTLRCISGLELPSEGTISLGGEDVTMQRASQRDIAFVFQLYALYPHLTAFGNIAFPLKTQRMPRKQIREEVQKTAKLLQIEHILNKKPKGLSGGDMQRVALGRALVRRPKVFLLDEPIGTLDAAFREEMRSELKRLHVDVGATTVYVTHDQMEAMSMGDRIAVMNEGVLQQVGPPHEVYADPANLFVAKFIGSPGMNFLDCAASHGNGTAGVTMSSGGDFIEITGKLRDALAASAGEGTDLVLGVRPEDVRIHADRCDNCLVTKVYIVEKMGSYNIVDIQYGEEMIRVRTLPSARLQLGQTVHATFDMDRIRLFDKKTEKALRPGTR
jgi:multiple sugar transport system ATP-binding protein